MDPARDPLYIKSHPTFAQKASSIYQFINTPNAPSELTVNCLNIAGTYGPLPDAYSEMVVKHANTSFRAFLDIFHHRLMGVLYQSYRLGPFYLGSTNQNDHFIGYAFFSLSGSSLFPGLKLNHRGIYPNFDIIWHNTASLYGIKKILSDYFICKVDTIPFQGGWMYPEDSEFSKLGKQYNTLDKDYILGKRIRDTSNSVIIQFGPISWDLYCDLIPPTKKRYEEMKNLCRYYIGTETHVQIRLIVDPHDAPLCRLSKDNFLGFTTWLVSQKGKKVGRYATSFSMF